MLNTGVTRPIDSLGRITIPKELRETFGFDINEPVDISINNDGELEFKHVDAELEEIGVFRKIDPVGRLVIPKEVRKRLDLKTSDLLLLKVDGKSIIGEVIKSSIKCRCCGRYYPLFEYNEMVLCDDCIEAFQKELGRSIKNV